MNSNTPNPEWAYDNLTESQKRYVEMILTHGPDLGVDCTKGSFCRAELRAVSRSFKTNDDIPNWIVKTKERRADVGVYYVPEVAEHQTHVLGEQPSDVEVETMEEVAVQYGG